MDRDGVDAEERAEIRKAFEFLEATIDGFGFCLSKTRDLLGQWRGYASDGAGVSIGFSHPYLKSLIATHTDEEGIPDFELKPVLYSEHEHERLIGPTYQRMRQGIAEDASDRSRDGSVFGSDEDREAAHARLMLGRKGRAFQAYGLSSHLFLAKDRAYREEKEWRLLSYQSKFAELELGYRSLSNRIVPYIRVPLEGFEVAPITEVILGPKHISEARDVQSLLKKFGFGEVVVEKSDVPYR